jgi:hypothetical protein
MKCSDGVVLVADKKVFDLEEAKETFEDKIIAPLTTLPVFVSAAGVKDLFREFNRKIPIIVQEKAMEIAIKNEKALHEIGRKLEDFLVKPKEPEVQNIGDLEKTQPIHQEPKKKEIFRPPYAYTGETFLDDCKGLIRNITEKTEGLYQIPSIEVLLVFNAGEPVLFYIDCYGRESQIDGYKAIGSGQPYVKLFFERLWDSKKSIQESIPLACLIIKFVEDLKLDSFVGVGKDVPQVAAMYKDRLVYITISREFMNSLNPLIEFFDKTIREQIKFNPLPPK